MNKLIDIFCDVDDFCYKFLPVWEAELIAKSITKLSVKPKVNSIDKN